MIYKTVELTGRLVLAAFGKEDGVTYLPKDMILERS